MLKGQWDGDPDGWHDWSMERYLSCPLPGSGLLKKVRRHTPAYIRWALDGGESDSDSSALRLGELVHTAIFEPDFLKSLFVPKPKPDPERHLTSKGARSSNPAATVAYREEVADVQRNHPTAQLVDAGEWDRAMQMRDAVWNHSRAAALIHMDGAVEASGTFTDPETGVRCKIRPDKLVEPIGANLQAKTTRNAARRSFEGEIARFGYHISEAFYARGLKALGFEPRHMFLLAIASEGPLTVDSVCVYELDDGTLDAGDQLVSRYLQVLAWCFDNDTWPGLPNDSIPLISLPDREWNRISDELLEPPPYVPAEALR